jgi:F-type H+-transporting ATPase subunit b
MQASIPSIVGQMIVFLIFVVFTMKYVWPPITKALAERQAKIADGLAAAERGQRALEIAATQSGDALKSAKNQASEIIAAASKQASGIVDQARVDAEAEKARIVAAGHAEVEREIDAGAHAALIGELAAQV